jgi:hypothetical protein
MLSRRKAVLVAAVLAVAAMTGYVVAVFNVRKPTLASADFRNAVTAEIRSSQAEIVLRGTFMLVEEEDDDIERKDALAATTGGEVMGEAEVEFAARGLVAGATYTLVVDGRLVATVAADPRGRIAIELEVSLPGAP